MMTRERLETTLRDSLRPRHLEIVDDSVRHAGHPGAAGGGGHYTVVVVSDLFEGKSLIEQHRLVYEALSGSIGLEIHALALRTIPTSDWKGRFH